MRILELTIAAPAPEELRSFYTELGFPEFEGQGGSDGYSMRIGYTRMNFIPGDKDARYHFAFNVKPDQLEEMAEWSLRMRLDLLPDPKSKTNIVDFPNWRARSVYFFDPAGNIVEFIARAPLSRAGNAPKFSAVSFTGVGEIGIVCDDVASMRAWISMTHGIPEFSRQQNTDEFIAMGDDEGLLLLVPAGRNWFMGNFPSERFPLSLVCDNGVREAKLMLP
jgi:catechol 2,3-dioxygenase-like lactoylglutathione lyase family enzyme